MDPQDLVARATAGRRPDRASDFKASLTYNILHNPYGVWCDLHAPRDQAVDETTRFEKLRMDWGCEHERRWVLATYPDAVEITPRWGLDAVKATAREMCKGTRAIYQPQLWSLEDGLFGLGDVLVRDDGAPSDLGPWHYRVVEIKRSRDLKTYQAAQALIYNRILARLQGMKPDSVTLVLNTGAVGVPVADYEPAVDEILAKWAVLKETDEPPELPAIDGAESPWRVYTNRILESRRDPSLCPVVTPDVRVRLRASGVRTIEDLGKLTPDSLTDPALWRRLESWMTRRPAFIPERTLTIPRRRRALYYDFETCDATHPAVKPHVYMIGAYDAAEEKFHLFTARGPDDEERIFSEFATLVGDPREAALYHWTRYEVGQMREAAARHPQVADRIQGLIDASVDLHRCVKDAVCFGTSSYSIKEVAPFLGFRWRQADVNAYESMLLYWEWLADGDDRKIAKVAVYNEDDCRAMAHVDRALSQALATAP